MCDSCSPKTGGKYLPSSINCNPSTGPTEYGASYKQWNEPGLTPSFAPNYSDFHTPASPWNSRYAFGKGARFGLPPYCDCQPPQNRMRFETTYQHDFFNLNQDGCRMQPHTLPGVRPANPMTLPKQHLCPFSTETTYARAFDMPQSHFKSVCADYDPCDDCNDCSDPSSGLTIKFAPHSKKPCVPKLRRECLIKPGTDTSRCCKCPVPISCCPCPDYNNKCVDCECGCEIPCKLHQATETPTRKYPIIPGLAKYVPDPRNPPPCPLLNCDGGTLECPLQMQFPTQAAIKQAKYKLMDKIENERCTFPPECVESTYRSSYRTPDVDFAPTYCSEEQRKLVQKANEEIMEKGGLPPSCVPAYCSEGGRPPDAKPMFDHLSTYEADFVWNVAPRFKILGGELPCGDFPIKPLDHPKVVHVSEVTDERTEEKERWGKNWECCPEPPQPMC